MREECESGDGGGRGGAGALVVPGGVGGARGAGAGRRPGGPPRLQRGEHGLGRPPALLQPRADLVSTYTTFTNITRTTEFRHRLTTFSTS